MNTLFAYGPVARYRKVVGDTCQGGLENQFVSEMVPCPIARKLTTIQRVENHAKQVQIKVILAHCCRRYTKVTFDGSDRQKYLNVYCNGIKVPKLI